MVQGESSRARPYQETRSLSYRKEWLLPEVADHDRAGGLTGSTHAIIRFIASSQTQCGPLALASHVSRAPTTPEL